MLPESVILTMTMGNPTSSGEPEYRLTDAGREYLTDLAGPDRDNGRITAQFTRRAIEIYARLNNWHIDRATIVDSFRNLTENQNHMIEADLQPRPGDTVNRPTFDQNFRVALQQRMNLDRFEDRVQAPLAYACLRDTQGGGFVVDPSHRGIVLQRTVDYVEHIGMSETAELLEEIENNSELEEDQIALLDGIEATDTTRTTTVRVEQPRLRRALFGGEETATCCICHSEVPNHGAYIWCAHIKRRSVADENERRDVNIVAGMCKFGCDTLYERGDIVVDQNGVVRENLRASNDLPSLRDEMAELDGNEVLNYSCLNAGYFEWHRDFHQID